MAKIEKMQPTAPEKTNLAAAVMVKLEAARSRLAALDAQVANRALAASLDEPGAARALVDLNAQLDTTGREVQQLESAHRLALNRDAHSLAVFEGHVRRAELAGLSAIADARLDAMTEVCAAIEAAAKAYGTFMNLTDKMAMALPMGMVPHAIAWHDLHTSLNGVHFPAPIDKVVAGEMWRHAPNGRQALPGASPLVEILRGTPGLTDPATEGVRRMNEYVLTTIQQTIGNIEQAALDKCAA